jgi:hypothetical protein
MMQKFMAISETEKRKIVKGSQNARILQTLAMMGEMYMKGGMKGIKGGLKILWLKKK